jgi:hypothetical protein
LLLAASIPLGRDALTDPMTIVIAIATLVLILVSEIGTLWILGSAASALIATYLHSPGLVHAPKLLTHRANGETGPRVSLAGAIRL